MSKWKFTWKDSSEEWDPEELKEGLYISIRETEEEAWGTAMKNALADFEHSISEQQTVTAIANDQGVTVVHCPGESHMWTVYFNVEEISDEEAQEYHDMMRMLEEDSEVDPNCLKRFA